MEQLFQAVGYATGAALLFLGKKLFDTVYEYVKKRKANVKSSVLKLQEPLDQILPQKSVGKYSFAYRKFLYISHFPQKNKGSNFKTLKVLPLLISIFFRIIS